MKTEAEIPELTVEDWTLLQARLAWCYEGAVKPEHRSLRSDRRHLCAWHVTAGTAEVRQGRRTWRAGAGQWLFAGPETFQQMFSADARILSVNFRLEWPSGESLVTQPMVFPSTRYPRLLTAGRALTRFVARRFPAAHVDLWRQGCGFEDFFELQRVFSRWVSGYLRAVSAEGAGPIRLRGIDPRVAGVLRRLERQEWAKPLDEATLAKEAGVSVGHLERLFSRATGLTPRGYLHKRRVEAATAALADASRPIKQTAYELGFVSPAHFSHWVRKATGRSPREHRRAGATGR
jgi:Transcriptional regulator containing an amidase domain and an AraC-type DNA-binding HTH domain